MFAMGRIITFLLLSLTLLVTVRSTGADSADSTCSDEPQFTRFAPASNRFIANLQTKKGSVVATITMDVVARNNTNCFLATFTAAASSSSLLKLRAGIFTTAGDLPTGMNRVTRRKLVPQLDPLSNPRSEMFICPMNMTRRTLSATSVHWKPSVHRNPPASVPRAPAEERMGVAFLLVTFLQTVQIISLLRRTPRTKRVNARILSAQDRNASKTDNASELEGGASNALLASLEQRMMRGYVVAKTLVRPGDVLTSSAKFVWVLIPAIVARVPRSNSWIQIRAFVFVCKAVITVRRDLCPHRRRIRAGVNVFPRLTRDLIVLANFREKVRA
ncbi:hypothetical protein NDN08_000999 [Rhodosorus marinus]|uniref:Membrane-associated protein n=1 Tax=Rhodosorus marinus TaxID=101924 RepID=A0AAV8UDU5_9RHOD|nr:hypothetical protein NDN08_000999 [Rhodosorus marinus]